jgi:hypothetical protein
VEAAEVALPLLLHTEVLEQQMKALMAHSVQAHLIFSAAEAVVLAKLVELMSTQPMVAMA